jgi:hypothetical protein
VNELERRIREILCRDCSNDHDGCIEYADIDGKNGRRPNECQFLKPAADAILVAVKEAGMVEAAIRAELAKKYETLKRHQNGGGKCDVGHDADAGGSLIICGQTNKPHCPGQFSETCPGYPDGCPAKEKE